MLRKITSRIIEFLCVALIVLTVTILSLYAYNYFHLTASIDSKILSEFSTVISGLIGPLATIIAGLFVLLSLREQQKALELQKEQFEQSKISEMNTSRREYIFGHLSFIENQVQNYSFVLEDFEVEGVKTTIKEHGSSALILTTETAKTSTLHKDVTYGTHICKLANFYNIYNLLVSINNLYKSINFQKGKATNEINDDYSDFLLNSINANLSSISINFIFAVNKFSKFYITVKADEFSILQGQIEKTKPIEENHETRIKMHNLAMNGLKIYEDHLKVIKLESTTDSIIRESKGGIHSNW